MRVQLSISTNTNTSIFVGIFVVIVIVIARIRIVFGPRSDGTTKLSEDGYHGRRIGLGHETHTLESVTLLSLCSHACV
jgi:hypothetical protein